MVLTGAGYVPLGQAAEPVGKRARRFAKDNPYHDERGRFTTADGAGGAASPPSKGAIRVAQEGEEDNRGRLEESGDPLAELKQQEWGNAIQTLRALEPNNPSLSYIVPQDWVPTDQNIADLNAEIAKAAAQRASDFVMPGGSFIGTQGNGPDVRILPGGEQTAQEAFDYLSVGGTPYRGTYPGTMTILPGGVGRVGLRNNSQGIPTVDINVPTTFGSIRFHYK